MTDRPRFTPDEIDPVAADRARALAREAGLTLDAPAMADLVARTGAAAPAVLPLLLGNVPLAVRLADERAHTGSIAPASASEWSTRESAPDAIDRALRRARHAALVRTTLREIYGDADVATTAREWSHVASQCLESAYRSARDETEARDGVPVDEHGARVPFVVLGMGKLGGDELNLGSDIDVCYFYGTDDGAAGRRTLHEHFARVATTLTARLDAVTADGFAFRVDLRLRPEGSRGAVANALASAERYYETWGRPWERAALLRGAPVAGDDSFGGQLVAALRPFVYRRGVDPTIAIEMDRMLQRSRAELADGDVEHLKLGRGGIREAEFFVQTLQLVWGGRIPALQTPRTLTAVDRLVAAGIVSHRDARAFGDAWSLLRRVEHRVQVRVAHPTHAIPVEETARIALARSLGYAHHASLARALDDARDVIHALWTSALPGTHARTNSAPTVLDQLCDAVAQSASRDAIAALARDALGVRDGDAAVDELLRLARRADLPLGAVARERHPTLGPRLLGEVRDAPDPDRALAALAAVLGRMRGAERYALQLADTPGLARGLLGLSSASATVGATLLARPDLLDHVLASGADAPSAEGIAASVREAVAGASHEEPDETVDRTVASLRRVQREVTLQVALADLASMLDAHAVMARLVALADAIVAACFDLAAQESAARYGTEGLDGIAVFALGSLAAGELGYGGDLDLIVMYAHDGETHGGARGSVTVAESTARLAQRALAFLSTPHGAGPGYQVDTRLRPSGAQGTLVVSRAAFEQYHAALPGRPGAGTWERQALVRSRFVAGDRAFGHAMTDAIDAIVYRPGPLDTDVIARMRERIETERGRVRGGALSLKAGVGGLLDAEFAAQVVQLTRSADRAMHTPHTRTALERARTAGYLAPDVADALLEGESLVRRALLAVRLVDGGDLLVPGTPAAVTVARRLGHRARPHVAPDAALHAELAQAMARMRTAWLSVLRRGGRA